MRPEVSVIVPCLNERDTIGELLAAVYAQSYPRESLELVVADGGSIDGTRAVIRHYAEQHPDLRISLIDNPEGNIPAGLNAAIGASSGEVVVRLDAHSRPQQDYVERCLETLRQTGAANVGGLWEVQPSGDNWIGRAIAVAAAHPLGAGDARYRISGKPGPVETVPFGAYPREWLERVGPFNERLLSNEDYEFNVRLLQAGGQIWFDPAIRTSYFARPNLASLAAQYWRYGYWKARMLRLFPGSLRWRQAIPPLFVLAWLALLVWSILDRRAWIALAGMGVLYLTPLAALAAIESLRRKAPGLLLGFPAAVAVIHFAWGLGFLWSTIRGAFGRSDMI